MSIFSPGIFGLASLATLAASGIASMNGAFEQGDLDEATRQGALAGPVAIERAFTDPSRTTQLAAIASAPYVEAGPELLPSLATLAANPDRRTAIPAALAARTIARELAKAELPDDLDSDDVMTWRARFEEIAKRPSAFIEVRVYSLDTVSTLAGMLAPQSLGFDLPPMLADPDPAIRAAAVSLIPRPTPAAFRTPLATAVADDADPTVALYAAQALCGDDPKGALPLLGARGIDRIKKLVAATPKKQARDAARCLAK